VANPGALLRDTAHPIEDDAGILEGGNETRMPALAPGTVGILELPARAFRVHRAADGEEVTSVVRRRV
jgi:hypothetical protein